MIIVFDNTPVGAADAGLKPDNAVATAIAIIDRLLMISSFQLIPKSEGYQLNVR